MAYILFSRHGNGGSERLSKLLKVTQLVSDHVGLTLRLYTVSSVQALDSCPILALVTQAHWRKPKYV